MCFDPKGMLFWDVAWKMNHETQAKSTLLSIYVEGIHVECSKHLRMAIAPRLRCGVRCSLRLFLQGHVPSPETKRPCLQNGSTHSRSPWLGLNVQCLVILFPPSSRFFKMDTESHSDRHR